jgi:hypothetical protein
MSKLLNDDVTIVPDPDAPSNDAFGRLRTSNPETLFSDKGYVDNSLFWATQTANGGAIDTTNSLSSAEINLNVTTASGSSAIRQTRQRLPYQPSKSHVILCSFVFEPKANVRSRVGYFDEDNGVFLEANGTAINWVRRAGNTGTPVDTTVSQSNWNIDPLDGTGQSGVNLDFTKAQLIIIDLEWFGVGVIRAGFVYNGNILYAHRFETGNILTGTYNASATLPIRYEITNTGATASATTLISICQSVVSEGGFGERGAVIATDNGTTVVDENNNDTYYPIISIRIKPTVKYSQIDLSEFTVISTENRAVSARIIINGTLTGPSWTDYSPIAQRDLSATAISGGTVLASAYTAEKNSSNINTVANAIALGFDVAGTPDTLTLAVAGIGGSAKVLGELSWIERY